MTDKNTGMQTCPNPLRRRLPAVLLLLMLVTAAACSGAQSPAAQQWLHGTWQLEFNPDFEDDDALTFREDGTVVIHTEKRRIIHGRYQVKNDELLLMLNIENRPVDVRFEIAADKSKLIYKTGAYYVKAGADNTSS